VYNEEKIRERGKMLTPLAMHVATILRKEKWNIRLSLYVPVKRIREE